MAWVRGMALLLANTKSPNLTPEMATLRGQTLRRLIAHLPDADWLFAVDEAICAPGAWFPDVAQILDDASRAPRKEHRALLVQDTRTTEERREDARHGLKLVKGAYAAAVEAGTVKPQIVTKPAEPLIVQASDERLDFLRRQAEEIQRES